MCGDGHCIPPTQVCDGVAQCDNDEDKCCMYLKHNLAILKYEVVTLILWLLEDNYGPFHFSITFFIYLYFLFRASKL